MSAVTSDSGGGQDFDLNITPIIDCFTVLIAFMLASASFLSISIFDAGVSAAGTSTSDKQPPSVNIEIAVNRSGAMDLKLTGKVNKTIPIPSKAGAPDHTALSEQLASLKSSYPDVSAATLSADNQVEYKEVIKTMEVTRKSLPYVMLGGF